MQPRIGKIPGVGVTMQHRIGKILWVVNIWKRVRNSRKIVLPDGLLSRVELGDMTDAGIATVGVVGGAIDVSNERPGVTEADTSKPEESRHGTGRGVRQIYPSDNREDKHEWQNKVRAPHRNKDA